LDQALQFPVLAVREPLVLDQELHHRGQRPIKRPLEHSAKLGAPRLHVVDLETGKALQKIDVATYVASSASVYENLVYLGDHDGRFSCVDLQNGAISWTWTNELVHLPFLASPSVTSDRVIIGNEDKHIYCFNREDGGLKWKFNTGSRVHASVVVAGRNVLSANLRGDLHILDIKNGTVHWSYELGSAVTGNPAVENRKFFVAASDGYLYCFGE